MSYMDLEEESCTDTIHIFEQITEKSTKFNKPVCFMFHTPGKDFWQDKTERCIKHTREEKSAKNITDISREVYTENQRLIKT
jgi:hypothetical protein